MPRAVQLTVVRFHMPGADLSKTDGTAHELDDSLKDPRVPDDFVVLQ